MTPPPSNHFPNIAARSLQQTCRSLKHRFLTNFTHDITFGNGQISMLVGSVEIFQFYQANKIPMLCTNDSGRALEPGIYLNTILENQYQKCSILMPLLVKVGKQFGQNYGKNSLHLVTKEKDCQHLYSLFFDLEENDFLHWVVNNGNFLPDVIAEYNFTNQDMILQAKAPESRIILPNSQDGAEEISKMRIQVIHKDTHIPIQFTTQQSRCLEYLMQGKSAKEIARLLGISSRTVEHYFEKIRSLLNCKTNKHLIAFYGEQFK
jgi:DNA-binding CsgD family transcriptional regulator